ncbi:MAG: hypothetical protein Fur002_14070 [Anaerolineales bacterium]
MKHSISKKPLLAAGAISLLLISCAAITPAPTSTSTPPPTIAPSATPKPTQTPASTSTPTETPQPDFVVAPEPLEYENLTFELNGIYEHNKVTAGDGYYSQPYPNDQITDLIFTVTNSSSVDYQTSVTKMGIAYGVGKRGYYPNFYSYQKNAGKLQDPFSLILKTSEKSTDVTFYSGKTDLRLIFFVKKNAEKLYFGFEGSRLLEFVNP